MMIKKIIPFVLTMLVFGCAQFEPEPFVPSTGHISSKESPSSIDSTIPELVEQVPLLPEPSPVEPPERYTVVVNEVPVKELLFALARDAKVNVDIHPGIEGVVTMNAVEQTLQQILKRISNQVDMRYVEERNTLIISRDTPFLRTYKIDYVNMSRDMVSSNTVATQITTTSSAGGSSGGGGGGNNSTTDVTSESINHFWEILIANITAIVGEEVTETTGGTVIVSPETGILAVRANSKQHENIQKFIDLTLASAQRQVLIRVTIAEVQLNENYQTGVNWNFIQEASKAGFNIVSTALTGVPVGTTRSFVLSYADPNTTRDERLTATVSLLDEFGETAILSSPQLMVLNNQTALLKVVENIVYFEIDAETTAGALGAAPITTVDTTVQTVPVGIVMTVTPQISDSGEISLNVRPTISRVSKFILDPNPSLIVAGADPLVNPVPQIQVREMESMLRLTDGEIGVLGGLMLDTSNNNDKGLPGVKEQLGIGRLFKETTIVQDKTELVIFIQPFIINTPSLDSDLKDYKQYLDFDKYRQTSSLTE